MSNVSALSDQKGKEESSYIPEFVPQPVQEKKKIVKKVTFYDDNAMQSAEKPHKPLRRLEENP